MKSAIIAAALLLSPGVVLAQAAEPFTLRSSNFNDNDLMGRPWAGNNPENRNCVGDNRAPQLSWSGAPQGTKSLVLFLHDAEGRNGLGVTHWVAYGIPPEKGGFAEGEIARAPSGFVGGKSSQGLDRYMGPCAPPEHGPHHYNFVAIATDLEPNALPPGLTLAELLAKLDGGHAKSSAGLILRYRYAGQAR